MTVHRSAIEAEINTLHVPDEEEYTAELSIFGQVVCIGKGENNGEAIRNVKAKFASGLKALFL